MRFALPLLAFAAASFHSSNNEARRDGAIVRSIPILQASAKTWTERAGCFSCHHQSLGSVAVAIAREAGFKVEDAMARDQTQDVSERLTRIVPWILTGNGSANGQIAFGYAALGLGAADKSANSATDALVHYMLIRQTPDGSWVSESHRPPLEDANETATALAVKTLTLYGRTDQRALIDDRVAQARHWLLRRKPTHHEGRVMRLLGLVWSKADTTSIRRSAQDLIGTQNPDGGWSQLQGMDSDAYATGSALVALRLAGSRSLALESGERFLVGAQLGDCPLRVRTRRKSEGLTYFETGFPHGPDQFLSYAATALATSALAMSKLGRSPEALTRSPVSESRRSVSPIFMDAKSDALAHAIVYGTSEQMRIAISRGADVSARSQQGITPLHLAAFDAKKSEVLLRAGAKFEERDTDGRAPIEVAALVGQEDSVRLLLAAGALPNKTEEHEASALTNAVISKDRGVLEMLVAAGARVGDKQTKYPPLVASAVMGEIEVMHWLLSKGARRETLGESLFDPLITLDEPTFEALLKSGADPNILDEEGKATIHWAAMIYAGHDRFMRRLIEHGGNLRMRDKSGKTPLELAVEHENAPVVKFLRGHRTGRKSRS